MSATDDDARRPDLVLVFSGHRPDAPNRPRPRFPAACEPRARDLLAAALARELAMAGGRVAGLAGGASGGDILFHEAAAELGMPTELCLAKPPAEYRASSVADSGPGWVARFDTLLARLPVHSLPPEVHRRQPPLSLWERSNLWMLDRAAAWSAGGVRLLALWSGEPDDGPGGTADMVARAEASGVPTVILEAGWLLDGSA